MSPNRVTGSESCIRDVRACQTYVCAGQEETYCLGRKVVSNEVSFSWAIKHLARRSNNATCLVKVINSSNQIRPSQPTRKLQVLEEPFDVI